MKRTMKRRSKSKDLGKYRSGLEKVNGDHLEAHQVPHLYEPKEGRIKFVIPASIHTYTPDFWIKTRTGKTICIETKGIWDAADRNKHAWIRGQYPDLDIRFVFTRARTPTSKGAKQTYADICEGRGRGILKGLVWQYADKKVPQEWIDE